MPSGPPPWRSAFRVGHWTVHPESNRIVRPAEERHLPPLAMDLLRLLAQHAGQVVTKTQILDEVWERRFVSESALTRAVAELRTLLDDRGRPARFIETIPKRGYRLVAPVEPPRRPAPALAVLPFDNLTRDPGEEYFADGVTEAIITELGKIAALRVISRQSTLRYKGTRANLGDIARDLQVDTIVEGSVQRDRVKVRLTAQLIEVEPERHVWAESFDCDLTDVLGVQSEVARRVSASIHAALRPASAATSEPVHRVHPEAHLAYLKGRHFLEGWTRDGVEKGLVQLARAIEIDPTCAPAYQELALAMMVLGFFGYLPMIEAAPRARAAALKAVELDDTLCMAHVVVGFVRWLQDWNLPAAEQEFGRAIELNPSSAFAYLTRALYNVTVRRDAAAMAEDVRQALDVDPLGVHTNFSAAWLWLFARDFDRAAEQASRTLELHPGAAHGTFVLALTHAACGRPAEAVTLLEPVAQAGGDLMVACLGHVYARAGRQDRAREILAEFERRRGEPHAENLIATVLTGLGDLDGAFAALARAAAARDTHLFWVPLVPLYDPLKADPRFALLLAQLAPPPAVAS